MITKQDIQAAASYIFRSSFVSEDQARKAMVKAGNNATKILVKTFRGKLFKLLEELVEERILVLLKDRKKKVVSIFYTIIIMVVCEAVIL